MQPDRKPIVDQCKGCAHIEGEFCNVWASPAAKWRLGTCSSATHVQRENKEPEAKVRVGQQKQKKRLT